MYLRPTYVWKNGRREAYWRLVESYRTQRGPRQRTVAYLGQIDEADRLGVQQATEPRFASSQRRLFAELETPPRYVEIDRTRVRVENCRQFRRTVAGAGTGQEAGAGRVSEACTAAGARARSLVADGVDPGDRPLVRALPVSFTSPSTFTGTARFATCWACRSTRWTTTACIAASTSCCRTKRRWRNFLKERFGELFAIEYDLLLYDVTSTYFEGQANANPLAKRGYSRDHRPDCKQVCIGLVVTRCGLPLGYEVFAGNRHDSTTLEEIVETMEARYGKAQRIWVLDRGMVSEDNIEFLKAGGRRYIVGTPKCQLKRFEQQLLSQDWRAIREGLEVKLCPCPAGSEETFVLCRSRDRREKEQAMHGAVREADRGGTGEDRRQLREASATGGGHRTPRGAVARTKHAGCRTV